MNWQLIKQKLKEPFFKFDYDDKEAWTKRECAAAYVAMCLAGWAIIGGIYLLATS